MCGRSFGAPLKELEDIQPALSHFVQNAVGRLWKYKQAASAITVYLSTNRFRQNIVQRSVSASVGMGATDNMLHLNAAAQRALEKVFEPGFEYHRVGVLLHDLVPVKNIPEQFFETILNTLPARPRIRPPARNTLFAPRNTFLTLF